MNETIIELINRIGAAMPELQLIDEDYGQLESSPEDQYPVLFPCVLVSAIRTDWNTITAMTSPVQMGTAEVTVRLAIDCYDDTHVGSGTTERITERDRMNRRVVEALHGYRPKNAISAMERVQSSAMTTPYNWKIYDTVFRWRIKDTIGTGK